MNFNFGYAQRKFGFQPSLRQFSTISMFTPKFDSFVPNYGQIMSNKSFSNPNFVNKQHPNILAPCLAGIAQFDKKYSTFGGSQNYQVFQPPKCESPCRNDYKNETEVNQEQQLPDKTPSQENDNNKTPTVIVRKESSDKMSTTTVDKIVENEPRKMEIIPILSPAMQRRNKRKKKKQKKCSNNNKPKLTDIINICGPLRKKTLPKNHRDKRNINKPWHKTNLNTDIFDCAESTLDSDSSNMMEDSDQNLCITLPRKTKPIEINTKFYMARRDSPVTISPCHHELLKTISGSSLSKSDSCSPCSPALRRLRIPSECESEDSFIVFGEADTEETTTDDSDSDFEDPSDDTNNESDYEDDVQFTDNSDTNKERKKVSFKCDSELCEVHPMIKWGYAYHTARLGPWEQLARDRARFEARIRRTEEILTKVLNPKHRNRIYRERFDNLTTD